MINKKKKFIFKMSEVEYLQLLNSIDNASLTGKTYPCITIKTITFLKANLLYIEKNIYKGGK